MGQESTWISQSGVPLGDSVSLNSLDSALEISFAQIEKTIKPAKREDSLASAMVVSPSEPAIGLCSTITKNCADWEKAFDRSHEPL